MRVLQGERDRLNNESGTADLLLDGYCESMSACIYEQKVEIERMRVRCREYGVHRRFILSPREEATGSGSDMFVA